MGGKISVSGFKALVSNIFKSKSTSIVTSSHHRISAPECDVIKSVESTDFRSDSGFLVIDHYDKL